MRQTRPFSKTSPSKCPRHRREHQDYSILPINVSNGYQTSCTDRWKHTKAPLLRGGVTKEGINTTIPPTTARIQGNTYKALTLPTEGRETHWGIFLALLYCIIFSWKFLNTDFGIGDVVAGTTSVAILRKLIYHFCNPKGDILAPSRRTQLDWRIWTSSVWRHLWEWHFHIQIRKRNFHQLLYSDGVQPRFCSSGATSPGSCGHHRRAYQTKSGNEATAPIGGESVQRQPGRWGR